MKTDNLYRWQPLTADGRLLWLKYWWGPGSANSLAFRGSDDAWVVLSPASDAPDEVYRQLEDAAPVRALVAPNGYHHLGQASWRARFPKAISLAPRDALGRLAEQSPGIPYTSLEDDSDRTLPAEFFIPDGMKTPDTLFSLRIDDGWFWWLGDQFSNNTKADQKFLFRLLSLALASGSGFHLNPKPGLVYVADKLAWGRDIRRALLQRPPALALCAHGDVIDRDVVPVALDEIRKVVPALADATDE